MSPVTIESRMVLIMIKMMMIFVMSQAAFFTTDSDVPLEIVALTLTIIRAVQFDVKTV